MSKDDEKPTIQHLVLCGGSTIILNAYGALREAQQNGVWNYETIVSFHGTSAGSILAFMLALNYPWETLDKYLICRPWKKLMDFDSINIYESFVGNGILDGSFFYETYTPLLKGKDIDINITFSQFYAMCGKELYFYALNLETFKTEELSHITYPDMRVVDAVYASSALPVLFKPFKYGTTTFTDGGVYSNYPMNHCLAKRCDPKSVLGVRYRTQYIRVPENMSVFDYLIYILNMILARTQDTLNQEPNEICLDIDMANYGNRFLTLESQIERAKEIARGAQDARAWLNNHAIYKLL